MFEPKTKEKKRWEKMHNDSLELYSSTDIVKESKSMRKRWVGNVHV
jgi:hypothetical protein